MEKLWTTAEVARFLGIRELDVERLVKDGRLTGYKLGGKFLRFRPDQVKALQPSIQPATSEARAVAHPPTRWRGRLRDFLYFYDFYILSFTFLAGVVVYLFWAG